MKAPTVQRILLEYEPRPENLLPVLKRINRVFGYVSKDNIATVSSYFDLSPAETFSAASFYEDLRIEPKADVEIKICMSAPCEVRGSTKVLREIERFLGLRADKDKTSKLEIKTGSCQGRCNRGPVVIVNDNFYEQVRPESVDDILGPYFSK